MDKVTHIIEDSRQQAGKHEVKHAWFAGHGIGLIRSKLPYGDYSLVPAVSIDTKKDMEEIAGNICGAEHKRFIAECKGAKEAGCHLVVLVENEVGIRSVSQVHEWVNPRVIYNPKCVQGDRLQKAMQTISARYGVEFRFCHPDEAAETIMEILQNYGQQ